MIGLVFSTFMWHISLLENPDLAPFTEIIPLSIYLLLLGFGIDLWAILSFKKAKTTINPMRPHKTSALVDTGVYEFSRNPMYVGLFLILSAWAFQLRNGWNAVVLIGFVCFITLFQIIPEEKALEELFPEAFEAYRSKVRRWI